MTDSSDHTAPDGTPAGDDLLAAEYVIGTLALAERLAAEARLKAEPALRAKVAWWEAHFAGLNDSYTDVAAPNLLPRIEARLFPVAPRRRFSLWQGILGAALAAGLVLAVVQFAPGPTPAVPDLVATLAGEGQPLVFAASYDIETAALNVTRSSGPAPAAGQDYELWVIGASGVPASLGVIPGDRITVTLPDLQADFVLAVSLEAAGGSTTGAPATVLVAGPVTKL